MGARGVTAFISGRRLEPAQKLDKLGAARTCRRMVFQDVGCRPIFWAA